jgi:hypothetical protein
MFLNQRPKTFEKEYPTVLAYTKGQVKNVSKSATKDP